MAPGRRTRERSGLRAGVEVGRPADGPWVAATATARGDGGRPGRHADARPHTLRETGSARRWAGRRDPPPPAPRSETSDWRGLSHGWDSTLRRASAPPRVARDRGRTRRARPSLPKGSSDYLRALRRRTWLVLAIGVTLSVAGAVVVVRLPAVYRATAQISIEPPTYDATLSTLIEHEVGRNDPEAALKYVPNQLVKLQSKGLAEQVVSHPDFDQPTPAAGDPAQELLNNLQTRPLPKSDYIIVTLEGTDPERTTKQLNKLLELFRDEAEGEKDRDDRRDPAECHGQPGQADEGARGARRVHQRGPQEFEDHRAGGEEPPGRSLREGPRDPHAEADPPARGPAAILPGEALPQLPGSERPLGPRRRARRIAQDAAAAPAAPGDVQADDPRVRQRPRGEEGRPPARRGHRGHQEPGLGPGPGARRSPRDARRHHAGGDPPGRGAARGAAGPGAGLDARAPQVPDPPRRSQAEDGADREPARSDHELRVRLADPEEPGHHPRERRRADDPRPPEPRPVPGAGHLPELRPGHRPGLPPGIPRPLGEGARAPDVRPEPAAAGGRPPDADGPRSSTGGATSGPPAPPIRSRPTPTGTSAPASSASRSSAGRSSRSSSPAPRRGRARARRR